LSLGSKLCAATAAIASSNATTQTAAAASSWLDFCVLLDVESLDGVRFFAVVGVVVVAGGCDAAAAVLAASKL